MLAIVLVDHSLRENMNMARMYKIMELYHARQNSMFCCNRTQLVFWNDFW